MVEIKKGIDTSKFERKESPVREKKGYKINKASEAMIQNQALINMGAVNNETSAMEAAIKATVIKEEPS